MLPWERTIHESDTSLPLNIPLPWLALLIFEKDDFILDTSDKSIVKTTTVGNFLQKKDTVENTVKVPKYTNLTNKEKTETCNWIEVK
jgi:hypothetical protein